MRLLVGLAVGGAIAFAVIGLARCRDTEVVTGLGSYSVDPIAETPLTVAESPSTASKPVAVEHSAKSRAPQFTGIDSDPLARSTPAKQDDPSALLPVGGIADPFVDNPNAVIGRPFPVSESVISMCRPDKGVGPQSCKGTMELLARMAEEPRDLRWARETESILRSWLSQLPDTTIRAIECRTSLCAIETSSIHGVQHGPSYEEPLTERLLRQLPMWGDETDASGAKVTVTMQLFKRRTTPRPER